MTAAEPVTPADATLSGFLQSIELAIVDAYEKVLPLLSDESKAAIMIFQRHHTDYATALESLAGPSAAKAPNATLGLVLIARLQPVTDEKSALTFAFGVENQLAETYGFAFATLTSPDVIRLAATTLPVVAGHAAIIGSLAGLTTASIFPNGPFEGTALSGTDNADTRLGFDPTAFPVG
jgi:hypothetical protein